MAKAIGVEQKLAIVRGVAWGTAVAAGARSGVLVRPHGIKKTRDSNLDDSLGKHFAYEAHAGAIAVSGSVPAYLRYGGGAMQRMIAEVMGTAGAPTYTSGVATNGTGAGTNQTLLKTGAGWTVNEHAGKWWQCTADSGQPTNVGVVRRITSNTSEILTFDATIPQATSATTQGTMSAGIATHVYQLAENLDGIFDCLVYLNGPAVDEYTSIKWTGFTIEGEIGGALMITFDGIAIDRETGSVVNTTTTFLNVTTPETANRIYYDQGVIRMNTGSGAALGVGDKIYPGKFSFRFGRNMAGVYGVGGSFNLIDEPSAAGLPECKLTLTFPRYTAATYFEDWDAGTAKKIDLVYTGSLIAGSSYRAFTLEIPNAQLSNVDAPVVDGIIEHPLEFDVLGREAAPTGMAVTLPFQITMTNDFCGDPLQAGNL